MSGYRWQLRCCCVESHPSPTTRRRQVAQPKQNQPATVLIEGCYIQSTGNRWLLTPPHPEMKTNSEALLIELCLLVCWSVVTIARGLLVPPLALLLTVAGWRPSPALVIAPEAVPFAPALHSLKVVELRELAREKGLKALARSGRKTDLLTALAIN